MPSRPNPAPGEHAGVGTDELTSVFRREAGRCTATLIRVLGDIDLAEDAVAEAFTIAASQWPASGVPPNPGGWITTTARRRAIDRIRRESSRHDRHVAALRLHEGDLPASDDPELRALDAFPDVVPDDQLRLMFLCCHPALHPDAQIALTLRLLGGLGTPEIASAFVVPESTVAQRIVRAKRKLRDNRAPYRIPTAAELPDRLPSVLATLSLVFTEGHRASQGEALLRVDLSTEAIRLARVLVDLMPDEPEALGLLALMLLTDARRSARIDARGAIVRLSEQDRTRWDRGAIAEGHHLVRTCLRWNRPGAYQIQAAIAAVHTDAPTAAATDWTQIVALYDQLLTFRPTAVVGLNRAIAVGERDGAAAGLAALADVDTDALTEYQPFHAARADLLARAGRAREALVAYDAALERTTSAAERAFLRRQRDRLRRLASEA